ncbi:MAG TPA: methyltransferase domain-containing protein [Rubrobacteraceae bacterium]|nr:methyltransferase domain-containing protein [Rubrobacteraceae bacterium]
MPLEWDAAEYEAVSAPQTGWGADFLEVSLRRRGLRGDEAAVDAGCGTGRVTELLLRHLPRGTVLAVDASEAMVEAARRRFAGDPRVRVERRDILELEVEEPVDVIFSTATFHWILDHERLFGRLARLLKPGGRLVAQCGGKGNITRTLAAVEEVMGEDRFEDAFAGWEKAWNFADPGTTKRRLEAAGFEEVETWLHEEFTEFGSVEELARFLKTVVLKHHLTFLPEWERDRFVLAVVARLAQSGSLVVDYVRLNMLATRSGVA